MRGVSPMFTAVRKLQACTAQLTTLHQDFLLLCFLSRWYKRGFSILNDDIYVLDIVEARDLLLYCYYGLPTVNFFGLSCFYGFEAVTLPMPTFSRITLEAYKKYILVSVIHHGQFSTSLPQYIPKDARWGLISLSEPYRDLVRSYDSGKVSELEICVQKNKVMFESDKNLGLVKQIVTSMYKHNIQKLTKIYLTLSLQDIANTVGLNTPKEAETYES